MTDAARAEEIARPHVWDNSYQFSPTWECCSVCGIVRRADDRNAPCKGPAKISLRANHLKGKTDE